MESRHISIWINRAADDVYRYAADSRNLTEWAAGIGSDMTVEFVDQNDLGVLDHVVTLPSGEQFYNPMRVLPGEPCEIVFALRRAPGVTQTDFENDAAAVERDLASLKRILERH